MSAPHISYVEIQVVVLFGSSYVCLMEKDTKVWRHPAGQLLYGDRLEEQALQIVREQLEVEGELRKKLGFYTEFMPNQNGGWTRIFFPFLVEIWTDEVTSRGQHGVLGFSQIFNGPESMFRTLAIEAQGAQRAQKALKGKGLI